MMKSGPIREAFRPIIAATWDWLYCPLRPQSPTCNKEFLYLITSLSIAAVSNFALDMAGLGADMEEI